MRAAELAWLHEARVGRLATVDAAGYPAVVPFCFALLAGDDPVVVSVLDEKPKRVPDDELARVRHIRRHPAVGFVVDHYDEDWSRLAFVQVRGRARLLPPGEVGHADAIPALREKYAQYRAMALEERAVIVIADLRGTSWRGDGRPFR
ncbi:MAG: TIGR03668 family PPOX class F420-dependent oxidoreductase [Chloroflexia bacterium]|nr:TIGR03668 family PPOX class F420-dependent oxidoreductase [Chloroflexia bacterium]